MANDCLGRGASGRVSVVMPCYNVRPYIEEALASVERQAGIDLEIILADDGSTDGTRELLEHWAQQGRVRAIFAQTRSGPYVLRNDCIRQSSGEYIAFLDGDDYWADTKLTEQLARLAEAPSAALSHTRLVRLSAIEAPRPNVARSRTEKYDGLCFSLLLRANGIGTSSVVVRRSAFDRVGLFDERFRFNGDWEMWARIAQVYPIQFLDRDLVYYRVRPGSISSAPSKVRAYAFAILDKFEAEYGLTEAEIHQHVDPSRARLNLEFGLASLVERDLIESRRRLRAALPHEWANGRLWTGLVKTFLYRHVGQ